MGLEAQNGFSDAVEWFLDHLRVDRGASPHTVEAYANDLGQAERFFAAHGVAEWAAVDAKALLLYQTSLGPPLQVSTQRRRLSSLRSLLKFLKRRGVGPACELPTTSGSRLPKRLPKALAAEQLAALLRAPDDATPAGLRDRALMELVYGAGL